MSNPIVPDGLTAESWSDIGAIPDGTGWKIRERGASGETIGWSRRFADGSKGFIAGGHRGLTLRWPLANYAGTSLLDPIVVVEGATDAAAGIQIGFETVGRFSATGGAAMLAELLRDLHIVIVGEHDESGAGRAGAEKIGAALASVCRSVRIIFPPAGIKDLRKWVIGGATKAIILAAAKDTEPVTPRSDSIQPYRESRDRIEYDLVSIADLGPSVEPDWLWPGYLARGGITLFTGLWKCGKTTVLKYLLRDLYAGGGFVSQAITGKVLIVSEEPTDLWTERRDSLGLDPRIIFLRRRSFTRPEPGPWQTLIEEIAEIVKRGGVELVIFDTLPSSWSVLNENDAGETIDALTPLRAITGAGAALMLVAHPRKSEGEQATATRGSGALTGFVDIILELRRHNPGDKTDCRRTLVAYGRYPNTPAEAVIELTSAGFVMLGERADVRAADITETILSLLPHDGDGVLVEDLRASWPTQPAPGRTKLLAELKRGFERGRWSRTGSGTKGKPYRYLTRADAFDSVAAFSKGPNRIEPSGSPSESGSTSALAAAIDTDDDMEEA